jgi:hypothetical protein
MARVQPRTLIAASFLAAAFAAPAAWSATAPADACSLLPPSVVSKEIGRPFGTPERGVAPRPYANTARGTDCYYHAHRGTLMFRIYFDASPDQAKDLFARLQMFFGSGPHVSGVGDETYFDSKHALHERKGNVRFYLELSGVEEPVAAKEKQLTSIARAIGGRL